MVILNKEWSENNIFSWFNNNNGQYYVLQKFGNRIANMTKKSAPPVLEGFDELQKKMELALQNHDQQLDKRDEKEEVCTGFFSNRTCKNFHLL